MAYQKRPYKKGSWTPKEAIPVPVYVRPTNLGQLQVNCVDVVKDVNNTDNYQFIARAGSGKSTTLVECCYNVPSDKTILGLAFNRDISNELSNRLAPLKNATVSSFHSFGRNALVRRFGRVSLNDEKGSRSKTGIILKGHSSFREGTEDYILNINNICKVVSLLKANVVSLTDSVTEEFTRYIEVICEEFRIMFGRKTKNTPDPMSFASIVEAIHFAYNKSATQTYFIDYDDMLWLPVILGLQVDKFDFIFVDEAQDLNAVQMELIQMAMKETTRLFCIGDDKQAIYAFRGADCNSMENLRVRFNMKVLPLSVTYRCPRKVVELVQNMVPDLEAHENAPMGKLDTGSFDDLHSNLEENSFIISRTNAPLVRLFFKLIKTRRNVVIRGANYSEEFIGILSAFRGDFNEGIMDFIDNWEENFINSITMNNENANVSDIKDKAECLRLIVSDVNSFEECENLLRTMFSEINSEKKITLTTAHKAKGLEREYTYVLKDTFMKYPGAQEENLYYVALTRTKNSLMLVNGDGKK